MKVGGLGRIVFVVVFTIGVAVLQRLLRINWLLAILLLALICECLWRLIRILRKNS